MSRRKLAFIVLGVLGAATFAAGIAVAGKDKGNDKNFEYAVGLWGDMPYSDAQAQTGVPNLIADMNDQDIEFSVHDGDLKAGNAIPGSVTPTTCQIATEPTIYTQGLGCFNSLEKPAIFTPGDNDWTDCDRTSNGGFNALERLQYERGVFFSTDRSLGRHTMKLEVQTAPLCLARRARRRSRASRPPASRTAAGRSTEVTFATLNVQGTLQQPLLERRRRPGRRRREYTAREAADEHWLQDDVRRGEGRALGRRDDRLAGRSRLRQAPATRARRSANPTTLAETDGNPDGFHDLLVELREPDDRVPEAGRARPRRLALLLVDKPLLDSTAGGSRTSRASRRSATTRATPDGNERRPLGEGARRPGEPRRLRVPAADRAGEPGRGPGSVRG